MRTGEVVAISRWWILVWGRACAKDVASRMTMLVCIVYIFFEGTSGGMFVLLFLFLELGFRNLGKELGIVCVFCCSGIQEIIERSMFL